MMQKVVGLSNASINAIDKQDLYKIFIEGNNVEDATKKFHLLISRMEYINATFDLVKTHDKNFQEVVSKMILDWGNYDETTNKNLKHIIGTSDLAIAIKDTDPYTNGLAKIIDPYMNIPENEITFTYTYKNLIRKLIDFFQDPILRDDPRTENLLTSLVYWDNSYTNIKAQYSARIVSCENTAKDLKESAMAIQNLLKEF